MLLWYQNRRALDLERWKQAGIAVVLELSFQLQSTGANRAPMMAAACFWDTSSSTFNIKFGQMGITCWTFCTSTQKITDVWVRTATLLFNGYRLGLAQMTLAMLYRALYDMSLHSFNYSTISGPLWILDLWLQIYFVQFRHPQITDFPDNQVPGMAFAGVEAHDPLDYSDCFQHLYTMDASILDASDLMYLEAFAEALTNMFMWCITHSPEAMHLFEQAISIADLRLPNDAGFELYAPNHFAHQLRLQ
ncbi:hypothetical protein ACLB2K_040773 [Fragaria x ananassa]